MYQTFTHQNYIGVQIRGQTSSYIQLNKNQWIQQIAMHYAQSVVNVLLYNLNMACCIECTNYTV